MRVGLDAFTLHPLKLSPLQMLDFAQAHGLAGLQFGGLGDDPGAMREVRAHADRLGLYSHISVASPNPYFRKETHDALVSRLGAEIARAAACGWHELHASLGGPDDRARGAAPWAVQLAASTAVLGGLAPVLRDHRCRINLEPHGDATTWELLRIVETVGPEAVGICLDTANVLCFAEDPVAAARRVAPYVHLTHAKDAILYPAPRGMMRQVRPPGQGMVDWDRLLAEVRPFAPDLPLSIEDHKWLFPVPLADPAWLATVPGLSTAELGEVLRLAWDCQQRMRAGAMPEPDAYEAVPFADQLIARLHAGRDHLCRLAAAPADRLEP